MTDLGGVEGIEALRDARIEAHGDIDKLTFLVRQAALYIETLCTAPDGQVSADTNAAFEHINQLAKFIFETSNGIGVLSRFPSALGRMELSFNTIAIPSRAVANSEHALLELEREFIEQDDGINRDRSADIDRWAHLLDEMIAIETRSLDGVRAKARVECRLRLGDLDYQVMKESTRQQATLLDSVLRDLIRTFDPEVEHPGAVRALLREMTGGDE